MKNRTSIALITALLAACLSLEVGIATEPAYGPSQSDSRTIGTDVDMYDPDGVAAASVAKVELQRVLRLLKGFEGDQSHAFDAYRCSIDAVTQPFENRTTLDIPSLQYLATRLTAARRAFEFGIEDVNSWRRFARFVDPDARLLRVPPRFIGKARVESKPLLRLDELEQSVWLRET